jgi:hypothetical protein
MKKKQKTKEEKKHLDLVASLGCLICQQPAICHHIRNRGDGKGNIGFSKKSTHYEVIPLCPDHHVGSFSIHNTKRQFESMYGTEAELLNKTLNEIKQLEESNNLFNFYAKEE